MMANDLLPSLRRSAGLWFFALLVIYALGAALGSGAFRPAAAASAQSTESAYVELVVADVEQGADTVSWLATRYDGRIADDYRWSEPGERWASLTVVLPPRTFASFYRELVAAGRVRAERLTEARDAVYVAGTRVTVLLVAAEAEPYPPPPPPWREPLRPIATWRPPSPIRVVLAIAGSLLHALGVIAAAITDAAVPALFIVLMVLWIGWYSLRRPSKK
jgi:hypothetical protein